MNCDEIIKSNDTYDVIIPREYLEREIQEPECMQSISDAYEIYYYNRQKVAPLSIQNYTYSAIPKCFGLLDTTALEESGILQLQTQSALSLRGQGVLVGFVDTGIGYENACFRRTDGSTRIRAIWDQTATPENEEMLPEGFAYGVEYSMEEINEALRSENPYEIVPQTDVQGHGTMLASIACGSEDATANFVGAAPLSDILVVKLKPAKLYLKEFYYIPENATVYQENDIMAAVAYLEKKAEEYGQPLIICLGIGTNNGSHSGASVLSEYLNDIGGLWRRCVVTATGNEASARHHFFGRSNHGARNTQGTGRQENGMPVAVEINVEENMRGFYLELWASAPELFSVSVRSPAGTLLPAGSPGTGSHQVHDFFLENTRVEMDYRTVGRTRGDQLVFIRFERAARGIWTLNVFPDTTITGNFHVWLPMTGMLEHDVVFLRPDPEVTLTIPSTAAIPITVGGYQTTDGSLYLNSGRGYTVSSVVKPDFAAPAVGVQAVGIRGNYVTMTGTSAAAAITAGACAQLMEWGAVRRRDLALNSVEIGNILIRGCKRSSEMEFPNPSWGYGKLDVYQAVRELQ
ncbi:MAG: S8 family peptidase [Lachnospiraceae bacterium]|nr:S8 family peptidase [Lachnospiraceae bacterium]